MRETHLFLKQTRINFESAIRYRHFVWLFLYTFFRIFEVIGKVIGLEGRTISWDARATNGSRSRISAIAAKITGAVNWFREYRGRVTCACVRRRRIEGGRKEGRKRRRRKEAQRASRSFASESWRTRAIVS